MKAKVVGNEDECWQCGTHVICREIPATDKYPAKPQWQNEDGSAHYNFDFKTKETKCNIPEGEPLEIQTTIDTTQEKEIQNSNQKISNELIFEKQKLILESVAAIFRIMVDLQLAKKEDIPPEL